MNEIDEWINSMPLTASVIDPNNEDYQAIQAIAEECPLIERVELCKENGNLAFIYGTKGADAAARVEEEKLIKLGIDPHALPPSGLGEDTKPTPLKKDQKIVRKGLGKNKIVGNKHFAKERIRDAVIYYTQGIELKCDDNQMNSTLYCNRALAQFHLGNYGHCVQDSSMAIKLNIKNIKAYYHASRACIKLGKLDFALQFVQNGLEVEDVKKELKQILDKQMTLINQKIIKENEKNKIIEKKKSKINEEYNSLLDAFALRGINIKHLARNSELPGSSKVYIDDSAILHYPLIIMYPQFKTSDFIQDISEEDILEEHLKTMFPPHVDYANWDLKREYYLENLHIYIQIGKHQSGHDLMTLIDMRKPLLSILLTNGYFIDGIPTLYIISKEYEKTFADEHRIKK